MTFWSARNKTKLESQGQTKNKRSVRKKLRTETKTLWIGKKHVEVKNQNFNELRDWRMEKKL